MCFDFGLGFEFHKVVVVLVFSADESALEVSVDHAGRLGGLEALADGPLPDFVLAACKEVDQIQGDLAGLDNLVETARDGQFGLLIDQLLLLGRAEGHQDAAPVGVDPGLDFDQLLVALLLQGVVVDVRDLHRRFASQKLVFIQVDDVIGGPVCEVNDLDSGLQSGQSLLERLQFQEDVLVLHALLAAFDLLDFSCAFLEVFGNQLLLDDFEVADRVYVAFKMSDFVVVETAHDLEHAIHLVDV
mmetsp:Transcript_25355/g.55896  ORF Transcript_25355/g.55896 Transcript_25355/m.55896 type:complete len:244 (-) Transcript_25355:326-1057(-)|eukprot:CAMPEP_0116958900 /NCGR_PEP_ID=MMETSP0467-20121206/44929_1 /TAXON_ID=283647 /ORGANISM="Mesodinium pulex, Strain SPMC105" /LENGTH=243 /DNA_ID=CAMNT_0004646103 /DNA_START=211 /DNA_END=942 /DNA_ORIENTATION=+